MNAINKEVEWQDMTSFSYTSKDDEYNDYEWMRKKRSCFRDLRNRFNSCARAN
jgi:hypothetical protein